MWSVEVEPEVEQWIESLSVREFARVVAARERVAEDGSRLRFPHLACARRTGSSSFESTSARVAWRVTFYFADDRRIVLLTTFRKQRQNERAEARRARRAIRRCLAEGQAPEEVVMARPTIEELRDGRLNTLSANERAEFEGALAAARLALEVGEKPRGLHSETLPPVCRRARRRLPASRPAARAPRSRPSTRPQQPST